MSELTISANSFFFQPTVDERDGPAILRFAYNRSFLADTNDPAQVQWGTATTGFGVDVPCSIASGQVTVDQDVLLWTTDDARDPSPASIYVSAWLLSSRGKIIAQIQIIQKTNFIVPSSLAPTTTWADFSEYNQAVFLANPPVVFYTAAQVDRLIDDSFDTHPASDTELGTVLLTVPADIPESPVVWGANDPLVRDADKIQGVDVSATAPLDTQVLAFNESNNQWEPSNQASGTGNVISNEVVSVDDELVLFSGTGGKTIKRGDQTGILSATAGVVAVAQSAESTLVGRGEGAGAGDLEPIILGSGLTMTGDTLSASGSGITQLTGDVTAGPGSGSQVATIPNGTVTYAKMQDVSAVSTLLGRGDSGAPGDVQEIQLGGGLSMTGTTLSASGSGGYDTVEDDGTPLTQRSTINFVGAGVTATDSGGETVVTIPGGGGGDVLEVQVMS